jgi:hypothetical protein
MIYRFSYICKVNSTNKTKQLSLFDDSEVKNTSKKSVNHSSAEIKDKNIKEGKVISLKEYEWKKAEERYNSYSNHLV